MRFSYLCWFLVVDSAFAEFDPEFGMGDQMFTDLALSRDKMREYHEKMGNRPSARRLSVMVLQSSVWPFALRRKGIDLPLEVRQLLFTPGLWRGSDRHSFE